MRIQKILKSESGAALVIALILMVVFTFLTLCGTLISSSEPGGSNHTKVSRRVPYWVESEHPSASSDDQQFPSPDPYIHKKGGSRTEPVGTHVDEASAVMEQIPDRNGAPRGSGMSAIHFEYEYHAGKPRSNDQGLSASDVSEKTDEQNIVKMLPTMQGGY